MQNKLTDGVLEVAIGEDMTIYGAQTIRENFLDFCNTGIRELQVDLSDVSELDSAGLQLLLLLKAESKKRAFELRLINHSQAVMEVLELLKLSPHFGDPVVIPAQWKKS